MIHYKNDLLTPQQLAVFTTKVGDKLILNVPDTPEALARECTVRAIKISPAGNHPVTGEQVSLVSLELE